MFWVNDMYDVLMYVRDWIVVYVEFFGVFIECFNLNVVFFIVDVFGVI